MQINYPYLEDRRATATFWNPPAIDNTAQDVDVPPIYAPYGTPTFWRDGATLYIAPSDSSVAPNSGQGLTVANTGVSGLGDFSDNLAPANLVATMPSIVQPNKPAKSTATCTMANWVLQHTGLALLAALGVFVIASGGRK
jgi:hypothetical protein